MARDLDAIAQVVHEALRAWSMTRGQAEMPGWNDAPEWMKFSSRESVQFVLDNPDAGPGAQHDQWMQQRRSAGWTYGPERHEARKTHPMLIPFEDLPDFEKKKDALVCAIVTTLIRDD